ncbi:class I SAM-dependent methyltransferase [Hymenobacter sp. BRD128]|uniref:class I SAM-dependent methyltransferase n=1 Tax=Hymenobacter sp. BRD128 TaxID=2675878 RepID=UPI001562EB83|nr:class I SAM-dependent methyltransferase [Hymenobacter sp. BRD128]QKG56619.1 class I SAM-dependent methyltransferase [Hymenobacter sp. BRD128]
MRKRFGQLLDNAAVFRYHRQRILDYGPGSPGALGWHADSQQVRFKMLAQIADLAHCSVLDVGCGYADLYPYLRQRFAGVHYHGIEQMPELLALAQARYRDAPDITLATGDFLRQELPLSDYVLASGSLNYRQRQPGFIFQAIETLYASSRLGLGFNLLSWEPAGGGPLVAYDPADIVAFCQSLAPTVELHEGYRDGDFTVFVYR